MGSEHERTEMDGADALHRAWPPHAEADTDPNAPCVVIVASGDEVRTLELMVQMGGAGDVHTVTDDRLAADRFLELRPDLVLIDLDGSQLNGLGILACLRRVLSDEEFLPVMVVAGGCSIRAHQRMLDVGAVDLVTRPYNQAEFVGRVTNLLRMRELYRTLKHHNIDQRAESKTGSYDTMDRRTGEHHPTR